MISSHRGISRRQLLVGGAASVALVACSSSATDGDPNPDGVPSTDPLPFDPALQQLGVRFPDGFVQASIFVAGMKLRAPFVPVASDGFPMTFGEPETIAMTVTLDGTEVFSGDVPRRRAGISSPYYPLEFVPEVPGTYEVSSDWSDTPRSLIVNERSAVTIPLIGDPLPAVDTPTFDDARGIDPICTRLPEPCPFHEQTLTDSLAEGKVTALLIATPLFCQTDICGPVVELLMEATPEYPNLSSIHAEVFVNPSEAQPGTPDSMLTEILTTYQLAFEPSLYLADADGIIVEALHFAFDRDELRVVLDAFAS